jgi:hypothetical protein
MKTLIKLIIAALLLHATWRAGTVYFRYYQFKDEVQQIALFSGTRSENDLHKRVMELAGEFQVPLDPDRVTVRRQNNHTLINATYLEQVEVLPRYFYPWQLTLNVDAFTIVPKND